MGITHLFKAAPGQRLVVPEHLVFREDLAITRSEEGMSKRQFMAEQEKAFKRKEDRKKATEETARKKNRGNISNPELREVKSALPHESFNLSAQQEALKAFEEARKKEQEQHSWHPGSDPTYETIPGDGSRPNPVPRHNHQNEGATANSADHERAHQQQGRAGDYPPTYPPPRVNVDPPDSHHSEDHPPLNYDNIPGTGNKQSTVVAIATKHQFVLGSRVEFSDPPRYGEIRWMGNFPQVDGLIVGVELVSCHYIYFVCVLSHNIGGGYGGLC